MFYSKNTRIFVSKHLCFERKTWVFFLGDLWAVFRENTPFFLCNGG